ncbi:MAG: CHAP domain-containing protein, partial [Deltaproteobacteria bacterium]|nr:CHAP domain-containing protein [Deltaproteobacteria bacterium]
LTSQAVIAFQMRSIGPTGQPLMVDGVVGSVTWWALKTNDQDRANHDRPFAPEFDTAFRNALAARTVAVAMREMAAGAREIGENNRGEFVEKYLRGKTGAWCAGYASFCVEEASRDTNIPMPFNYTGGARNILRQLEAQGFAFDEGEPMGGDLMFWWRSAPDSWKGHVEIVTHFAHGTVFSIGGNRGKYPAPVRRFNYSIERERQFLSFARLGT